MITSGMTGVPCVCGKTHRFTPSAMAVLLLIAETGELHYVVGSGEIRYRCLFAAIQGLSEDDPRLSFYRGSIRFDEGAETRHPSIVHASYSRRRITGIDKTNGAEGNALTPTP
jgi:hypothetical protein